MTKKYRLFILEEFLVTTVLRRLARRNTATGRPRMVVVANDYIGHWISVSGGYEHNLLKPAIEFAFAQGIRPDQICLDIGANIGNHAAFFSECFSSVIAVEANPAVFRLLEINAGNFRNIECHNLAVGSARGTAEICPGDPINEGTGYVRPNLPGAESCRGSEVRMDTIDHLVSACPEPIGLIKIDIEGMEQAALDGARSTIARYRPAILFEYHRAFQDERDTIELLRTEHGYSRFYYVAPRFDLTGHGSAIANFAHVLVNLLANSRFEIKEVRFPVTRSFEFVIALP